LIFKIHEDTKYGDFVPDLNKFLDTTEIMYASTNNITAEVKAAVFDIQNNNVSNFVLSIFFSKKYKKSEVHDFFKIIFTTYPYV
jgi:hypothetical protein